MMLFRSLTTAIQAGFQVEQPVQEGYLVRTKTLHGWARALVVVNPTPQL